MPPLSQVPSVTKEHTNCKRETEFPFFPLFNEKKDADAQSLANATPQMQMKRMLINSLDSDLAW